MKRDAILTQVLLQTVIPGGIILNALRGNIENIPKESDLPLGVADSTSTAHTVADDLVQEVALAILHNHMPEVSLNAEEKTPRTALFRNNENTLCYHLDPLDGTLTYTQGKDGYAIGAAFSDNRKFIASAIHFPALDRIYVSHRGAGVSLRTSMGDSLAFQRQQPSAETYIQKRSEKLLPIVEALNLDEFDAMGAHHGMLAIAEGRARVLMYRLASPHDFGIPQVIVEEAGGICTDIEGKTIVYDEGFGRVPWFLAFFDETTKDIFFENFAGQGWHY
ncbi:MAG: inositol monophosphatase family protein [Candidatus Thorarchaeota archaeon]